MQNPSNKNVTVIDCGSSKTPEISRIVTEHGDKPTTIDWHQANSWDFQQSDAVIISGGPHLFTDSEKTHQELMQRFEFLKQLKAPTLGICLGHQAIALTFGGKVYRGPERRETDQIETVHSHALFANLPTKALFREDHCEGIHTSDAMIVLARSEHYAVEAIEVIDRPFLGVQFHPEASNDNGKTLLENFLLWSDDITKRNQAG